MIFNFLRLLVLIIFSQSTKHLQTSQTQISWRSQSSVLVWLDRSLPISFLHFIGTNSWLGYRNPLDRAPKECMGGCEMLFFPRFSRYRLPPRLALLFGARIFICQSLSCMSRCFSPCNDVCTKVWFKLIAISCTNHDGASWESRFFSPHYGIALDYARIRCHCARCDSCWAPVVSIWA